MKAVILGLVSYTALTLAASAADLPRRAAPPVFTPVPVFTWTGIYAGFNAGYAWSNDRLTTRALDPTDLEASAAINGLGLARQKFDAGGFTGGAQIGYNYQFTPGSGLVVGFEADAQYTDLKRRRSSTFFVDESADGGFPPGTVTEASAVTATKQLSFLGTVRGRLGYAWDRVLVYGTGGFAYGQTDDRFTFTGTSTDNSPGGDGVERNSITTRHRKMQTGYAYGGGIEYALPTDSVLNFFRANAITLKVEYLHYDLGSRTLVDFGVVAPVDAAGDGPSSLAKIRTEGNIVRAGLNYKFGSY